MSILNDLSLEREELELSNLPGKMEQYLVKISEVEKVYRSRGNDIRALEKFSLEIKQAEFVSVVGPSGCGKSTLMMMIAGLYLPTVGSISIGEERITKPYTNVGIVFQRDVLLDWRTVLDNVLLPIEVKGLDKSKYLTVAADLLNSVGLAGFEEKYPSELSGGMRQRVAICRALVHDPPLLLMDEPFGALDALTREKMASELLRIWENRKKTVMFITHSIPEAVFLSDRIVVMSPRPGKIQEIVNIALPRPRTPDIQQTIDYLEYTSHIRSIFQAVGVLD